MSLDGVLLHLVKNQLLEELILQRVDKVYQPSKHEVVIQFKTKQGTKKLYINTTGDSPRIHIINKTIENPKSPPMFCLLLRKLIGSGKLMDIKQHNLDRILIFEFISTNEIGDIQNINIIIEIMGRHSNLIITDSENKVIDSIKRISIETSSIRPILPGILYHLPPMKQKLNLLEDDFENIINQIITSSEQSISKSILSVIDGVSPIFSREICFYISSNTNLSKPINQDQKDRLVFILGKVKKDILNNNTNLNIIYDHENSPKYFSFIDILQYGVMFSKKNLETPCLLLDTFFERKEYLNRIKQKADNILKVVLKYTNRASKRIKIQQENLEKAKEKEKLKSIGELITANIYKIKYGDESVIVQNYFSDSLEEINIKLDPKLSPSKNAQYYFNKYRKLITSQNIAIKIIKQSEDELKYLDSIFDFIVRSDTDNDLLEITQELSDVGYIKNKSKVIKKSKISEPKKYISSDGYTILCGKNNNQNDILTTKKAAKNDIWLHTQNIPGSHVIIITNGTTVPNSTIEQACLIASVNSKAHNQTLVAVDYTHIKNVKKPKGAKPGMVIFDNYKTAFIKPNYEICESLKII